MRREGFNRLFPLLEGENAARGPMIAADHLAFLMDQPLNQVCRNGELLGEGLLRAQRLYRSDLIIVFADVSVEAEAMGVKLEYMPDRNPQAVQHLLPDAVKIHDMASRGRIPELFQAARKCRDNLGDDFPIFFSMKDPFSLAALVLGTEPFMEKLLLEPNLASDALEICRENQLGLIDAVISAGFIPFVGAPMASGGLIGAGNFRRFAAPYMSPLFDRAEDMGSFRCLHICGQIEMLGQELAALNLDLLSFEDWHPDMWAMMPRTVPMGFVPTNLFQRGTRESVRQMARECRTEMPEPQVLSTGCDLPARAKPELVQAMMDS